MVESADGLGKLLAQQLVAAGEDVVDAPPTLSARVRLLGSTKASNNDPNDALAIAVAGLRHRGLRAVRVDDHSAAIRMLVNRYDHLTGLRTQRACRLHATQRASWSRAVLPGASRLIGRQSCCAQSGRSGSPRWNASDSPATY